MRCPQPRFPALLATLLAILASLASAEVPVSFSHDIMPLFAKHGCSAGACHGNANGKGGFKLSLRGENPAQDAATLSEKLPNRRVKTDDPNLSLLLRKPSKLTDHEGGEKFTIQSESYQLLQRWIAEGARHDVGTAPKLTRLDVTPAEQILEAPQWHVQLQVQATFSDGSSRDVSRWAVYEASNLLADLTTNGLVSASHEGETTIIVRYLHLQTPVRLAFVPQRPDYAEAPREFGNFIDDAVAVKLRLLKLMPSEVCDDTTFLRRTSFDVLGLPPNAAEARAFINDPAPSQEKRTRLVDSLLARPEYGEQWALRWSDLLRNEEKVLDRTGVVAMYEFLRDRFNADVPLSEITAALLTGDGSTYLNGAANFYRALRDPSTRAETTAQVFLGVRLRCAKCHNHPFEHWSQDDYYRFAGLFDAIDYQMVGKQETDKFDKHYFNGEQIVYFKNAGDFKDPRTNQAPQAGLLDAGAPALPQESGRPRFQALAQWITDPSQTRFAQVQANRIWFHLLGTGIVDPVDDFRATNPPSNPRLLEALAAEFMAQGYRLKPLVRAILLSRTYQTSSVPNPSNQNDAINFSHALVRRRTAEQLLDGIHGILDKPTQFRDQPTGQRAGQRAGVPQLSRKKSALTEDDQFLICFGKPRRLISSETERRQSTSLGQVFTLTSSPGVQEMLAAPDNRLTTLLRDFPENAGMIDELCWLVLSRPPTSLERSTLLENFHPGRDRRLAAEDLAWALLNTKEFLLRP